MSRTSFWSALLLTFVAGVLVGVGVARDGQSALGSEMLPRFTEEREAAALHFVKKNLPDLLPLLDKLKKNVQDKYQQEIREIYQASELLSDLGDDPQRYDLELKVWIAEYKAQLLVTKLATPQEEERKKFQAQLQDLAKELVKLDLEILDLKTEQLERQLVEVKDEATRLRGNRDKMAIDRFKALVERANKRMK